jgi:hypothetical protein
VLAPHAPLRAAVTAHGRDATAAHAPPHVRTPAASPPGARTARYRWAILLAPLPDWDSLAQPAPELALDQRIAW